MATIDQLKQLTDRTPHSLQDWLSLYDPDDRRSSSQQSCTRTPHRHTKHYHSFIHIRTPSSETPSPTTGAHYD